MASRVATWSSLAQCNPKFFQITVLSFFSFDIFFLSSVCSSYCGTSNKISSSSEPWFRRLSFSDLFSCLSSASVDDESSHTAYPYSTAPSKYCPNHKSYFESKVLTHIRQPIRSILRRASVWEQHGQFSGRTQHDRHCRSYVGITWFHKW